MPVILTKIDCWDVYTSSNYVYEECKGPTGKAYCYDRYKLHIGIHANHFKKIEKVVTDILFQAVEKDVIHTFKVFYEQRGEIKYTSARQLNFPFVIYLKNQFDQVEINHVIELCQKIEEVLCHCRIPLGDASRMTVADVPLPGHFIFRQTAIREEPPYEYIPADDNRAPILRELAVRSEHFKALQKGLQIADFKKTGVAMVVLDEQKSNRPAAPRQGTLFNPIDQKKEKDESSCGCSDAFARLCGK